MPIVLRIPPQSRDRTCRPTRKCLRQCGTGGCCITVRFVDLRRNNISGKAAARLAQAFPSARALEVLSGLPLRSYLDNPPTTIELTSSDLRLPEAVLLRDTLARTIKMTINKLDNYEITSSLTELDLSTNLLDEGAMDVLASLVEAHSSLTTLDVSHNQGCLLYTTPSPRD